MTRKNKSTAKTEVRLAYGYSRKDEAYLHLLIAVFKLVVIIVRLFALSVILKLIFIILWRGVFLFIIIWFLVIFIDVAVRKLLLSLQSKH